ncbi:MAG TPA: hypothetical protein VFB12_13795 [Ktedonobacteraceae bacterium]|nr:hypothetical protein [Ktedonobacteraceae bacterium]
MKQSLFLRANIIAVLLGSLFIMMLFSACSGVASTGTNTGTNTGTGSGTNAALTIVGSVQSVSGNSVTLTASVNGQQQQYTITGLTPQQITDLQQHIGKTYTIQVTQNGTSYTITPGSNPQETDNATSGVTPVANTNSGANTGVNEPGTIDFIGKVQSANGNSIVVSLPNGDPLTMNVTVQTDRSDFANGQVNAGQFINAKAQANTADGSFVATKLSMPDNKDLQNPTKMNTVDIVGVATSAVGSDNVLHVKVGSKAFDLTLSQTTQMKDFGSPQAIATNQPVKVTVIYNGASATVLKVENNNS